MCDKMLAAHALKIPGQIDYHNPKCTDGVVTVITNAPSPKNNKSLVFTCIAYDK